MREGTVVAGASLSLDLPLGLLTESTPCAPDQGTSQLLSSLTRKRTAAAWTPMSPQGPPPTICVTFRNL